MLNVVTGAARFLPPRSSPLLSAIIPARRGLFQPHDDDRSKPVYPRAVRVGSPRVANQTETHRSSIAAISRLISDLV